MKLPAIGTERTVRCGNGHEWTEKVTQHLRDIAVWEPIEGWRYTMVGNRTVCAQCVDDMVPREVLAR